MKSLHIERSALGWPIFVDAVCLGTDWLLQITGGCAPHIGSISVGTFENGEVILRKILLPTHRDDVIGNRFAEVLARQLKVTVTVICDIHYETPGQEGLRKIVDCSEELLRDIQMQLMERHGENSIVK